MFSSRNALVGTSINLRQGMFINHFKNAVNSLTESASQIQLGLEEARQLRLEEGFISQAEKNETVESSDNA